MHKDSQSKSKLFAVHKGLYPVQHSGVNNELDLSEVSSLDTCIFGLFRESANVQMWEDFSEMYEGSGCMSLCLC